MNWEKIGNFLYVLLYDNFLSKTIFWIALGVCISILVGLFMVWIIPDWAPAYGVQYYGRLWCYFWIGLGTVVVLALIILLIAFLGDADWID